ncbi:MAG: hypothetical protein ACTSU2_16870 [Promethearchaeota archaeon]
MLNIGFYKLATASILFIYALWIALATIRNWDHPKKTFKIKFSELIYAVLYFINGIWTLFLFKGQNLTPDVENRVYMIMFFTFAGILFWLWIPNLLYTYIRVKRHPELLEKGAKVNRNYEECMAEIEAKQALDSKEITNKADFIKDVSRKALHFLIFAVLIVFQVLSVSMQDKLADAGLTPIVMRNFIWWSMAFFFNLMFTTADIFRVYKFKYLPDWGITWYTKSIEPKTEKYSFISSVPFLLTLVLFIFAPFPIVLGLAVVPCISDAAASIIGKSLGKHKMTHFGRYPHKSYEGFFAGASTAFVGVILVFEYFPLPKVSLGVELIMAVMAALAFMYVDAFSKYVVDNVLNTLIPGLIFVIIYYFII